MARERGANAAADAAGAADHGDDGWGRLGGEGGGRIFVGGGRDEQLPNHVIGEEEGWEEGIEVVEGIVGNGGAKMIPADLDGRLMPEHKRWLERAFTVYGTAGLGRHTAMRCTKRTTLALAGAWVNVTQMVLAQPNQLWPWVLFTLLPVLTLRGGKSNRHDHARRTSEAAAGRFGRLVSEFAKELNIEDIGDEARSLKEKFLARIEEEEGKLQEGTRAPEQAGEEDAALGEGRVDPEVLAAFRNGAFHQLRPAGQEARECGNKQLERMHKQAEGCFLDEELSLANKIMQQSGHAVEGSDEEVVEKIWTKRPSANTDGPQKPLPPANRNQDSTLELDTSIFWGKLRRLRRQCAPALSGSRNEHFLLPARAKRNGIHAQHYRALLCALAARIAQHGFPPAAREIMTQLSLGAVPKTGGAQAGFRTISIGEPFMRLVGSTIGEMVKDQASDMLSPEQFAVGTRHGMVPVPVRLRLMRQLYPTAVAAKLDLETALDQVDRASVLRICAEKMPRLLNYVRSIYPANGEEYMTAHFFVDNNQHRYHKRVRGFNYVFRRRPTGVARGEPLAMLLFCLVLDTLLKQLAGRSPFTRSDDRQDAVAGEGVRHTPRGVSVMAGADDIFLLGPPQQVEDALAFVAERGLPLGLKLNPAKSELLLPDDIYERYEKWRYKPTAASSSEEEEEEEDDEEEEQKREEDERRQEELTATTGRLASMGIGPTGRKAVDFDTCSPELEDVATRTSIDWWCAALQNDALEQRFDGWRKRCERPVVLASDASDTGYGGYLRQATWAPGEPGTDSGEPSRAEQPSAPPHANPDSAADDVAAARALVGRSPSTEWACLPNAIPPDEAWCLPGESWSAVARATGVSVTGSSSATARELWAAARAMGAVRASRPDLLRRRLVVWQTDSQAAMALANCLVAHTDDVAAPLRTLRDECDDLGCDLVAVWSPRERLRFADALSRLHPPSESPLANGLPASLAQVRWSRVRAGFDEFDILDAVRTACRTHLG